ncbi:YbaB/EbfC family nucleoid-associated protein, partial [Crossiella equi]|uniref:YbaB/EbfC family nucleoid-associated protein n=1 Tax=Crossiella equi TaxID=130796 RepID=UPI00117744E0
MRSCTGPSYTASHTAGQAESAEVEAAAETARERAHLLRGQLGHRAGTGELKALEIDPKVVDPEDTETLADLVVAAVRDANRAVAELTA